MTCLLRLALCNFFLSIAEGAYAIADLIVAQPFAPKGEPGELVNVTPLPKKAKPKATT